MPKLNLLIPMNGLGTRFRDEGYNLPKPLINVLGKPMIFWLLDNLNLTDVQSIIIPYTTLLDDFDFQAQLRERYKQLNFKFYPMNFNTRGAAETVYIALDNLDSEDLKNQIMLMDCDTFYFSDIISQYQSITHKNNIFYFIDNQDNPIYSYIAKDDQGMVTLIKEKRQISRNANCGIYCFESAELLKDYCKKLIDKSVQQKNEFYISGVYQLMIEDGIQVGSSLVENFHCVGTPIQLKIFCENYTDNKIERFCFDLDRTLVTAPKVEGDYSTCEPIERNVNFLKHLKSLGHYIIIYTARRMRTNQGQLGRVMKEIGKLTYDQLDRMGIPYDEIHFGKPYAAFYIDDLAVNCNLNLEKQIGYYNSTIKSRSFNNVEIMNSMVIKSGNIDGEQFYYKQLENYPSITNLFPRLLEHSKDKIIIEKIKGLNFSYLLTNNCLSENQFNMMLDSLLKIHSIEITDITAQQIQKETRQKLLDRYKSYDYSQFYNNKDTLDKILEFLDNYTVKSITAIHGDPVFTNIIVDNDNIIKFIDMRGKQGSIYTIGGDPIYDLSKIYQSLSGYDCVLNNTTFSIDQKLLKHYENWVNHNYEISMEDIRKFAAGLYFSLIPLHNNEKCQQYYQLARNLINS
jgi:capsule biosynthesis phosphatase